MSDLSKKIRYVKDDEKFISAYDVSFDFSLSIISSTEFSNILNGSKKSILARILLPANNLEISDSDLFNIYREIEFQKFDETITSVEKYTFQKYIKSMIADENFHKLPFGLLKKDNLIKYNYLNKKLTKKELISTSKINYIYSSLSQNKKDLIDFWKFRNNNLNFLSIGEIRLINNESRHLLTKENIKYIAINSIRNILNLKGTKDINYKTTNKSKLSIVYGDVGDKIRIRKSLEFKLFENRDPKVFFDIKDYN